MSEKIFSIISFVGHLFSRPRYKTGILRFLSARLGSALKKKKKEPRWVWKTFLVQMKGQYFWRKKKKAFSNVAGSVWTVLDISPS